MLRSTSEADLVISDGVFELTCYCGFYDPEKKPETFQLLSFLCSNIIATNENCSISKKAGYYEYSIVAKLISKERKIVSIGEIFIQLDSEIPGDMEKNHYLKFSAVRIDLII